MVLVLSMADQANFLDTANVYGGDPGTERFGWSERVIAEVLAERKAAGKSGRVYVATKGTRQDGRCARAMRHPPPAETHVHVS